MPFNVFLSHSSADKPAVEELARRLAKEGIQAWLDKWHLIPGNPWQPDIEKALEESETCAVFVGPGGFGPWQNEEMRASIDQRVRDSGRRFRVIPVLLPGAKRAERSSLPTFLAATTWVEFPDSLDDPVAFHRLVCGIRGLEPGAGPGQAIYEGQSPYRGLRVFDVDDAPFFFGREALVQWIVNELRPVVEGQQVNRFLSIVGSSGSGKSSVARAGLVAAIKRDEISASSSCWPVTICRPGSDPLESLVVALSRAINVGQGAPALAELIEEFQKNEKTLHLIARQSLPGNAPNTRLVVVMDQFEEVFTLCRKEELREALIRNLLYAARVGGGQTLVILTMRADFYAKCAVNAELAAAFSDHHVLVGPMSEDELRRAIEQPIQLVGGELEGGLVDLLLGDVRHQAGALPLLQHALLELWQKREGRRLTVKAYQEIGKLEGALQRRADATLKAFSRDEQELCRRTFLRLTQPGEGTEDTKRRASMQELLSLSREPAAEEDIIQKLTNASLLTTEGDLTRKDAYVEVAHEALIRGWPQLRQWMDEDRAGLRLHRRISEVAQEWQRSNKEEGMLYRGARLTQAQEWHERNEGELNLIEREFLDASIAERQKMERRQRQRQRLLIGAAVSFAVLFIAASGAAFFGFWQKGEAVRQRIEAKKEADRAAKAERTTNEQKIEAEKQKQVAVAAKVEAQAKEKDAVAAKVEAEKQKQGAVTANINLNAKNRELSSMLEEASRSDRLVAEERLGLGEDGEALAYLARASRYVPKSSFPTEAAMPAVLSTLLGHPQVIFQGHTDAVNSAVFSSDGRRVLTASDDGTARLWEAESGRLVATFQGHTDSVNSAAFSPDGRRVLTASADNTARLWETESGKLLNTFQGHTETVYGAIFSPDGRRVLTASADNTARLWDAGSGRLLAIFQGHTKWVRSAVFSPDGRRVLTASADKTARLWEAESGKLLITFRGHTDEVPKAVFSADGRRVLTASEDTTARLWDAENGKLLVTFAHTNPVESAVFSPEGRCVLTTSVDKTARLWEAESGKLLVSLALAGYVNSALFSPDGRRVLTVSGDNASDDYAAQLWEVERGRLVATFHAHTGYVNSAVFSPDGRRVLTASDDGTALLWEAQSSGLLAIFQGHTQMVTRAVFSPDGRRVLTASQDKTARLWDTESGKLLATFQNHDEAVYGAVFSPDGRRVLTESDDKVARIWDAEIGRLLATFQGHTDEIRSAVFSPDGRRVLTASADKTARLWEAESGKLLNTFQGHTEMVTDAVFSPDGRRVLTASADKTARLWEAESGKLLNTFQGHTDSVTDVVFSPDGRRVLTASLDNSARLWEVESGSLVSAFQGWVWTAVFSPNGRWVLTSSLDKSARLWEAESGKLLTTFQGHTASVTDAVFSPDGRRVLTASADKTARLWEAESGQLVATFQGHTDEVSSAVFSPDGRRVLTASWDKTARLWPVLPVDVAPPDWCTKFLVWLAGKRIASDGQIETLPVEELHDLVTRLHAYVNEDGDYARLLNWRLSTAEQRPVDPYDTISQERAADLIIRPDMNEYEAEHAYDLDPWHPLIALALAGFERDSISANFLRNYALNRLPNDPQLYQRAAEFLREQGIRTEGAKGAELLVEAVVAYRSALKVYTREQFPQDWAATQNSLGTALVDLGERSSNGGEEGRKFLEDAVAAYRSALEVRTKADLPQAWAQTQTNLSDALRVLGNRLQGEAGLKRRQESIKLLRDVMSYQPDDLLRYRLASALGDLAFNLVLDGHFAEAQTRCQEAQRLANEIGGGIHKSDRDSLIFIQQNLAHALLFQGHYDEALAIYRQYWDKPQEGKTFGEVTLEDFAAFDKAGLTHPDLSRMKQALRKLPSKAPSP
jgi:WD40 repeat protein